MTSAAGPKPFEEPIAIVGLACRLPGAPEPEAFWKLLMSRGEAIGPVPADRWDGDAYYHPDRSATGKSCTRLSGFVEQVDGFDPEFFGISPREALHMDPQQRLALELTWEGLEDAGIPPHTLQGGSTGVFFGAMWTDYEKLHRIEDIAQHSGTGWHLGVVPGRTSYALGLRGPSLAVNTACSSSLVAVHLACRSLLAGESSLAVAGGVSLMLAPHVTVAMSKFGGTSPSSRTYAYDARGDGYVRGEGGGLVVLRRLSQAQARGERIYALIRGGAVNNDGFSEGLTAPSSEAQRQVLEEAYAVAGIRPHEVDYVEGHGTGTAIGDPIEANALGAVLGAGREPEQRWRLGSVKTNIGHTEAASGVAGLIKVALAMQRGVIPASLHFEQPNPAIAFEQGKLAVTTQAAAWPERGRAPIAGVNSFGFGGTNCHLVLQGAPAGRETTARNEAAANMEGHISQASTVDVAINNISSASDTPDSGRHYHPLLLSAHTSAALDQRIVQLGEVMRPSEAAQSNGTDDATAARPNAGLPNVQPGNARLRDVSFTLRHGRTHLPWRAALICRDAEELRDKIERGNVLRAARRAQPQHRPVFVFSGHGSQWARMGAELWGREPVFREALEACSAALQVHSGWSVVARLRDGQLASKLERVDDIQPVIFAFQVALTHTLRHYGVHPAAVVGHSMGEVAAAYAAGAVSLQDAALLTWSRSEVLARISGRGGMLSIALFTPAAEKAIAGSAELSIAVDSGSGYTVVSGALGALDALAQKLAREGVEAKRVNVDVAAHSVQIEPLVADLQRAVSSIQPRQVPVEMVSSVTGSSVQGEALDAAYWTRNIRQPVRFGPALQLLLKRGHRTFVEVSPHPLLLFILREVARASGATLQLASVMRRGRNDEEALLEGLATLHNAGCEVDWEAREQGRREQGRIVSLPPYPWQRRRFWPEPTAGREQSGETSSISPPFRGDRLSKQRAGESSEGNDSGDRPSGDELRLRYEPARRPLMRQHVIAGRPLLAAGVAIAQVRRAADLLSDSAEIELREMVFHRPIDVERGAVTLTMAASRFELSAAGQLAVSGRLAPPSSAAPVMPSHVPTIAELRAEQPQSRGHHYAALGARAVHYHGSLRSVQRRFCGGGAALIELDNNVKPAPDATLAVQLDACFQAIMAALDATEADGGKANGSEADGSGPKRWLVAQLGRVIATPNQTIKSIYGWLQQQPDGLTGGAWLLDEHDRPVGTLEGVDFAPIPQAEQPPIILRNRSWSPQPLAAQMSGAQTPLLPWRLHCEDDALANSLRAALRPAGVPLSDAGSGSAASEQWLLVMSAPGPHELHDASAIERACASLLRTIGKLPARVKRVAIACATDTSAPPKQASALSDNDAPRDHDDARPSTTPAVSPITQAVWAMARVLSVEHPNVAVRCIQFPLTLPETLASELTALSLREPEPEAAGLPLQVVLTGTERLLPELIDTPALPSEPQRDAHDEAQRDAHHGPQRDAHHAPQRGTVIVTGGLGGIGRHVINALLNAGYRELALLGRSRLNAETEALLCDWNALLSSRHDGSGRVRYFQIDISDRDALAQLLPQLSADKPISGVIHAAATVADSLLRELTEAQLSAVLAGKAHGAWWLHELTAHLPLSFFVMFGSLGSWVGLPGQGAYAAANAFLDGLAEQRRRAGLPALCIGWCGWRDTGFAATAAGEHALSTLAARGYAALSPDAAIELFDKMLHASLPGCVAVMPSAPQVQAEASASPALASAGLIEELRAVLPASRRRALLQQRLVDHVAAVLRQDTERVQTDRPLKEQGLDSMMTVELRDRLENTCGIPLSRTLVWQYPTVNALADHLLTELRLLDDQPADMPAPEPDPELDSLLSAIENMPEEAVKDLLDGR